MLMHKELSGLVLVDVQEKLTPQVLQSDKLISRCSWLLRLASALNVPVLVNEQYPRGLGQTMPSLREDIPNYTPIEKVQFSCYRNENFVQEWRALGKKQMILAGIETHVCVLQTAMEVIRLTDDEVFVVVDAVSSRSELDHKYGLKRMKQAGIELVTSEMVFFEWIETAGSKEFKVLSRAFFSPVWNSSIEKEDQS